MMEEKLYHYTLTNEKVLEKIIDDEHIHLNHMGLPQGESLPVHFTNANIYMIVAQGVLNISLDDGEERSYVKGEILNIPYHKKMNATNRNKERLELFVIKAPHPMTYSKK
ncbi:MAG: cupin domain-containing protein [Clostridia bacterium]